MGQITTLTSSDGHSFEVYEAAPDGNPMGTIVVVQEIFGVNSHIREVAAATSLMCELTPKIS